MDEDAKTLVLVWAKLKANVHSVSGKKSCCVSTYPHKDSAPRAEWDAIKNKSSEDDANGESIRLAGAHCTRSAGIYNRNHAHKLRSSSKLKNLSAKELTLLGSGSESTATRRNKFAIITRG